MMQDRIEFIRACDLKAGLTIEEHRQIGDQLKRINGELTTMTCRLSAVYPVNSRVVRLTDRLCDKISGLRCELDRLVYDEHETASPAIYY